MERGAGRREGGKKRDSGNQKRLVRPFVDWLRGIPVLDMGTVKIDRVRPTL